MEGSTAAAAGTITIGGDLTVQRLGLGTNRIRDNEDSRRVLRRAVELGVNFVDTADVYTQQESERVIGETLGSAAQGVVIATKGAMTVSGSGAHGVDGRPEYLRRAVVASLQRLQRARIDLYFLHRVDPKVPLRDSVSALAELQQEGRLRHVGLSDVTVTQIEEARRYVAVAAVENSYSVSDRKHQAVLDYCEREGIPFVAYYPLRYTRLAEIAPQLRPLRQRYSATAEQLALAWLLQRSPVLLPIPGTTSVRHLEENVAATAIRLSPQDAETLDRLAR